ncbi:Hypothetical protein BSSP2_II0304 [Brucella suis bv. 2]|nr:Hypothetical protein BSSP3_II0304 [Brucella suis bv. 2]AIB22378.1 Hypothetical protein BSPT1_II0299 [Brucella suis bv. 2]AIB25733.1 Hypothetical protein BSPT2_II0299 [Brucella suis bv. 2]AIB29125.1 Hypothetical protein BSSP1_II0299 [Brucella suis bv. 2]AIB32498.1 Hypothetical protein BSSP2_II0304 [Brucella suis bv. 2]
MRPAGRKLGRDNRYGNKKENGCKDIIKKPKSGRKLLPTVARAS